MRMTQSLERLLRTMMDDPSVPWHGYELMKKTKLASGTMYPMLARLEVQGLVSSAWEVAPSVPGRPPRKYYQLTAAGVRIARERLTRAPRLSVTRRAAGPGLAGSS
jgi:PadR family transcriptional regulator, regulatory protein PadR